MRKWFIESLIAAPFIIWFISFVAGTYKVQAEVEDTKQSIQEIKLDVKYIRNYLLEHK